MVRLCAMSQSASGSCIILPNQSRRAEFQPTVGRACFFSSSSVGFAAEVPSAWLAWAGRLSRAGSSRDRRPLGGMRVGSRGRGAQRGAGGVRVMHAQGPRGSLYVWMCVHLNVSASGSRKGR